MSRSSCREDRRERRHRGAEVERHQHDAEQSEGSSGPQRSRLDRLHRLESRLVPWPTSPATCPLSQRPRGDEREVTSDRRAPTATVLRAIAAALRAGGEPVWDAPTEDGATVAIVIAHLVAGFDRPPARRALDTAQRALGMDARAPASASPVEGAADAAAALDVRAALITERPQSDSHRGARRCRGRSGDHR